MKQLMQLTSQEEALLAGHNKGLRTLTAGVVNDIYGFIMSFPELARMLEDRETQNRHRTALKFYIDSLSSGKYDEDYIKERQHIGDVHFRLGVKPDWYLAAYRKFLSSFVSRLAAYTQGDDALHQQIVDAIVKVAFLDVELALNSYLASSTRALESQRKLAESALRVYASTASIAGEEFFPALARSIKIELGMRHVFIIGLEDGLEGDHQFLGVSTTGELDMPRLGMPRLGSWSLIRALLRSGSYSVVYPRAVLSEIPDAAWLRSVSAESMALSLLRDSKGSLIGVIAAVHDEPIDDENRAATLLSLFSARTSMEIERIRFDNHLTHQATHDTLTGLPNRLLLADRLQQELLAAERRGHMVAVLFIDLDDFKTVNDCFGHDVGDHLLVIVAQRLRDLLREEDTVARYGGDEFVIILGQQDGQHSVELVVQKIIAVVEELIEIDAQRFHTKACVGIALYPQDGMNQRTLLRNADTALYRAKSNSATQHQFFAEEMNAEVVRRVALEEQLRAAIKRNELLLHYQPQVDLVSGRIIGIEALMRWTHPHRGPISPAEFIPLAEANGMIHEIGARAIEQACRDLSIWRANGHDELILSVNISPRQFESRALLDNVLARLAEFRIPHDRFEIELTESLLIANPGETKNLLRTFSEQGIGISMDDFGTGYSSLSYLKQYPIKRLKIDQSFVRDMADDPNDAAIVQAIIAMSHALDIAVIAEGVETQVQCHRLVGWGCLEAQGYYFGRPMPADAISSLLDSKSGRFKSVASVR